MEEYAVVKRKRTSSRTRNISRYNIRGGCYKAQNNVQNILTLYKKGWKLEFIFLCVQEIKMNSCVSKTEIGKQERGTGGGLVTTRPDSAFSSSGIFQPILETVEPGGKFYHPQSIAPMIPN